MGHGSVRRTWSYITYPREFVSRDGKQHRQPGYVQPLEHLEYVKQGYELYTFVMGHSLSEYSEDISQIKKFSHHLQLRYLVQLKVNDVKGHDKMIIHCINWCLIDRNSPFRISSGDLNEQCTSILICPCISVVTFGQYFHHPVFYPLLSLSAKVLLTYSRVTPLRS